MHTMQRCMHMHHASKRPTAPRHTMHWSTNVTYAKLLRAAPFGGGGGRLGGGGGCFNGVAWDVVSLAARLELSGRFSSQAPSWVMRGGGEVNPTKLLPIWEPKTTWTSSSNSESSESDGVDLCTATTTATTEPNPTRGRNR